MKRKKKRKKEKQKKVRKPVQNSSIIGDLLFNLLKKSFLGTAEEDKKEEEENWEENAGDAEKNEEEENWEENEGEEEKKEEEEGNWEEQGIFLNFIIYFSCFRFVLCFRRARRCPGRRRVGGGRC